MAWISIHDSIDGPKLRDLYKCLGCSKYEATGILVYLWHWGIHNADRDGLILHADIKDIETYLYGMKNGCTLEPEKIIKALIETGWIDECDDGLHFHDWADWQKEWYKYQDRLKKDAERKRMSYNRKLGESPLDNPKDAPVDIPAEKKPSKPKRPVKDYSESFLKFWSIYPKQENKSEAYKCFIARIKEGVSEETLISAAETYAMECRKQHKEKQYILQAKTFLGPNLRFRDFVSEKKEAYFDEGANPFDNFLEG